MTIIIISIVVFVIMLLFPIMFSLFILRKSDGKVLEIQHSKIKDARYFVKSFTELFDNKWKDYDGSGKILLSHEEKIIEADITTQYPTVCDSIVYAENMEFQPPAGIRFEKEIYACQNAYLFGIDTVRAVCCKKNLILDSGTHVVRWVDAEGALAVYDDCDLGISASSITKIVIGSNCRFRRLYAPAIFLGQVPEEESLIDDDWQTVDIAELNVFRNIKYVDDEIADEEGVLEGSIISTHDITVLNSLTVKGHIRSNKSIRLCDDAMVYGNIFAEGDVYLGNNTRVYGSVLTQENFYAESGVAIGQYGKIKSVIARGKIIFEKNCRVYGYVSSEKGGECCPDIAKAKEDSFDDTERRPSDGITVEIVRRGYAPKVRAKVTLPSVKVFEQMGSHGFRKIENIIEAIIPEGVTIIPPSLFYQCQNLRRVVLPSTIEEIGAFAFFGCDDLEKIVIGDCYGLRCIGEAAFEGCVAVREVKIPVSCQQIGTSAFCGSGVESVLFESPSSLLELESHVFKDCTALKQIEIPKTVTSIGTSAFYGCTGLTNMVIPETVERIDSYAFCGCTGLISLRILSRQMMAGVHVLKGLPRTAKILLANTDVRDAIQSKEQRI